jgi:hypothetical protein
MFVGNFDHQKFCVFLIRVLDVEKGRKLNSISNLTFYDILHLKDNSFK